MKPQAAKKAHADETDTNKKMQLEMKLFSAEEAVTTAEAAEAKLNGGGAKPGACVHMFWCVGAYVCLCACELRM